MSKQWRELYNQWEKAVAPGLEQITASDGFRDFMAAGAKFNSAVTAEFERASRRWLHFWNLPAATDVRKLRRQVASIDRELKGLRSLVADAVDGERATAPVVDPSSGHAEEASPASTPDLSVVEAPKTAAK